MAEQTPKEKAFELVDNFYQTTPNESWINEPLGIAKEYKAYNQSKQCALIAVDEIINTLNYDIRDLDVRGNILLDLIKYWQEVKEEIEKTITMEQQTAMQWLQEIDLKRGLSLADWMQAKRMEKEQIQKAFSDGQETPLNHPTLPLYSRDEYYKETFGGL